MDDVVKILKQGAIPAIRKIEDQPDESYKISYPVINDDTEEFFALIKRVGGGMHFFIPSFVTLETAPAEAFLACGAMIAFAHFLLVPAGDKQNIAIEALIPPPFAADARLCVEAIRASIELHYRFHVGMLGSQLLMASSISGNKKMAEGAMEEIAALQAKMASLVGRPQEGI